MVLTRSLKRALEGENNTNQPPTKKTKGAEEKETEDIENITIVGSTNPTMCQHTKQ